MEKKQELIDFLKIKSVQSLEAKEIEKLESFIKWLKSLNSLPNGEASNVSTNELTKEVCLHEHRYLTANSREWYCPDGCGYFERQTGR